MSLLKRRSLIYDLWETSSKKERKKSLRRPSIRSPSFTSQGYLHSARQVGNQPETRTKREVVPLYLHGKKRRRRDQRSGNIDCYEDGVYIYIFFYKGRTHSSLFCALLSIDPDRWNKYREKEVDSGGKILRSEYVFMYIKGRYCWVSKRDKMIGFFPLSLGGLERKLDCYPDGKKRLSLLGSANKKDISLRWRRKSLFNKWLPFLME